MSLRFDSKSAEDRYKSHTILASASTVRVAAFMGVTVTIIAGCWIAANATAIVGVPVLMQYVTFSLAAAGAILFGSTAMSTWAIGMRAAGKRLSPMTADRYLMGFALGPLACATLFTVWANLIGCLNYVAVPAFIFLVAYSALFLMGIDANKGALISALMWAQYFIQVAGPMSGRSSSEELSVCLK